MGYPLQKCDHIAVQDFAFGAMENWGAVTYRENLLLVYPEHTTKENKVRIASVIIHETSHMWFGNLVSPSEWKYIWLNESFASFFTSHITDLLYPEWGVWDDFIRSDFLSGLERDAYRKTHPIELKGDKEVKIDSSTSPIIYDKGASVLRMLIHYVGEENFKKACQNFLDSNKYTSVSTKEFWESFEKVSDIPIVDLANSWIYQGGFPYLRITRDVGKLQIQQERFTFILHEETLSWIIPLTIEWFFHDKETEIRKYLMETRDFAIDIPEDAIAYKINADLSGFYRVLYPKEDLLNIGTLVLGQKLSAEDRISVVNNLFAFMRRGDISVSDYLEFIKEFYYGETHYLPLMNILGHLSFILRYLPKYQEEVKFIVKMLVDLNLNRLGFVPKEDETVHDATLRAEILWMGIETEINSIKEWGLKHFSSILNGEQPDTELKRIILKIGTKFHPEGLQYILNRYNQKDCTQAEKMQLLSAMVNVPTSESLISVMDYCLKNISRNNKWIPFQIIHNNPVSEGIVWDWFKENLREILVEFQQSYLGRVLKGILATATNVDSTSIIQFFENNRDKFEEIWESVELAIESYQIIKNVKDKN